MSSPENHDYGDIFPYISCEKKTIIFEVYKLFQDFYRYDNYSNLNKILIPSFINKNELYIIANKFKAHEFSDIELYLKDNFLENDESSIECILNGDIIRIKEELDLDFFYIKNLINNFYKYSKKIKIKFIYYFAMKNREIILKIPSQITIKQLIEACMIKIRMPFKYKNQIIFFDSFNNILFYEDYNLIINRGIYNNSIIKGCRIDTDNNNDNIKGLKLDVRILDNKNNIIINMKIGSLDQIKTFYNNLELQIVGKFNKILTKVIIFPENIELTDYDERVFSQIGIRKDFICYMETKNNDNY
jgi:hypothetical protein